MIMDVKITARITFPEGTQVPEEGRGFTLPDGNVVKPFVIIEKNDLEDLTYDQAAALGLDLEEIEIEWEQVA